MHEATFEVKIPADLLAYGFDQNKIQQQVNQWLVFSLFTEGHISSGKGGQLLGISRLEFLHLLKEKGIAYIDYSPKELAEEFDAVEALDINTTS